MPERYYTTHEVSKFCNVYPTTVIKWITDGILSAFTTPGGHRRIKKKDLLKLMQKNSMPIPEELLQGEKFRVLLIDDDVKILKMIETILEKEEDLEVSSVKNGFEAGIMISQWQPNVILLDMLMPQLDGFEVCRRIRETDNTKDIPVIAVTVLRDEKEKAKMRKSGITDYLTKPFKSQDLIEKVRKQLERL